MMNRKQFEDRLVSLKRDHEQLLANRYAIEGAIQDCEFWIAEFDKQESSNNTETGEQ